MASTKTRRTGKEGLHTRVKQGKKTVKDREVIEEQSADGDVLPDGTWVRTPEEESDKYREDEIVHDYVEHRVEQYRLVTSKPRSDLKLDQKIKNFSADADFNYIEDLFGLLEQNGLVLADADSSQERLVTEDNNPVADADELVEVLTNMARICGWRLTYKLERL